jgi:hypothetical protein
VKDSKLSRREFTLDSAVAILSGVVITITGCSDSPSSPSPSPSPSPAPTPTTPAATDVHGTISANHGHTATINAAELTAGNEITLDIRGNSDHRHTLVLTAAELSQISNRQQVSKESSNDAAHTHFVTFN